MFADMPMWSRSRTTALIRKDHLSVYFYFLKTLNVVLALIRYEFICDKFPRFHYLIHYSTESSWKLVQVQEEIE